MERKDLELSFLIGIVESIIVKATLSYGHNSALILTWIDDLFNLRLIKLYIACCLCCPTRMAPNCGVVFRTQLAKLNAHLCIGDMARWKQKSVHSKFLTSWGDLWKVIWMLSLSVINPSEWVIRKIRRNVKQLDFRRNLPYNLTLH